MSGAVQLRLLLVGAVLGTVVGGCLLFPIGRSAGGATPAVQATRRPSASPFVVPARTPAATPEETPAESTESPAAGTTVNTGTAAQPAAQTVPQRAAPAQRTAPP